MHVEAPKLTINLLDALPALANAMNAEAVELARRHMVVPAVDLDPGSWAPSAHGVTEPGDLGLLIVDGFMTRDVHLGATVACEVVGRGDLLRPSDHDGDAAPVP